MLKIKDDVDLKELEKFGFRYDNKDNKYLLKNKFNFDMAEIIPDDWFQCRRSIGIYNCSDKALSILYDLIKADLVEKVGTKNGQN